MNDLYNLKHSDLLLEFARYIATHPKFSERIPEGAEIILLDYRDSGYTRFMLKNAPRNDNNVVFIDVGELAPVRSRMRKPKIVTRDSAKKSILKLQSAKS